MTSPSALTVAMDTTGDIAGVALFEGESLLAEVTWRAHQSHSRELLPTLEWLLQRARRSKTDLGAIVVCTGPGSYAGMRVGVSTAKALAFGLGLPVVGIGRLAADAYPIAVASGGRVIAVQAAGRAELAWAIYDWREASSSLTLTLSQRERGSDWLDGDLREIEGARLGPAEELLACIQAGDVICGEIEKLNDALKDGVKQRGVRLVEAPSSRVVAVARLGLRRIARGEFDNAETLVPMYLRAPAIGPQPQQ